MKRIATLLALSACLVSHAEAVEIQKSGPEAWPGKFMVGARPGGIQLTISNPTLATYKFGIDFAGKLLDASKLTLWLGGEINVGGAGHLATIEPGIFVMLTLEKLLNIPLVPMVRAGISGPLYIPYGYGGAFLYGAFEVKFGGGAYYFLTKNIGIGADMDFALGPGFFKDAANHLFTGWGGYWDFMVGGRFAF